MFKVQAALLALLVCSGAQACGGGDDMMRHSWGLSGGLSTGSSQSLVRLQKEFIRLNGTKVEEDESGYYTTQFGIVPPPNGMFDATATVTYKVNGQPVVRQVTLGQGTSISGICEAIDVLVQDTSSDYGTAIPSGSIYAVSINVVKGTRASSLIPPTLKAKATLAGGATVLTQNGLGRQTIPAGGANFIQYAIPTGVGVASAQITVSPAIGGSPPAPVIVVFLDTSGLVAVSQYQIISGSYPIFVDIPPNAAKVSIFNDDAANDAVVGVTWGIDG